MARKPSNTTEAPASTTEESTVSTTTEAPVEATESTETTAAPAEAVIDLTAFNEAVEAALPQRDETTGVLPDAALEPVINEYRKLPGQKPKNAAKNAINEAMAEAMNAANLPLARANLDISQRLTAGSVASAPKEPKAPVNPTEAFVERVAGLVLSANLVQGLVPEGVDDDWAEKVTEAVNGATEQADAYAAWLGSDAEDKGEAPETPAFIVAAVKLAHGKSAKVGAARKSSGGTSTFEGTRRDVAKHIAEAFAGVESGTFLSIADIRKHKSDEYGEDSPSAGAVSARLFPSSGKPTTVEGVTATTNDKGVKGATKI